MEIEIILFSLTLSDADEGGGLVADTEAIWLPGT